MWNDTVIEAIRATQQRSLDLTSIGLGVMDTNSISDKRKAISGTWRVYPTCAYLYPNGDILVSYQGNNIFPYPMGLAKFDKDSKLLWKRDGYYHHWFSVDAEGKIYVPGATVVDSPLHVKGYTFIKCKKKQFPFETVVILDSGGNKIKEIDLHKALMDEY